MSRIEEERKDLKEELENVGAIEIANTIASMGKKLQEMEKMLEDLKIQTTKLKPFIEKLKEWDKCEEEKTWVKNKAGKKYFYYYIKCKDPYRSIYGGNSEGKLKKIKQSKKAIKKLAKNIEDIEALTKKTKKLLEEARGFEALLK